LRRLQIGDRLLRIRDEGEGAKTPVCFVHGAGSSSVVWMDAVRRIAPRRRVIAVDLPGHGQSDRWHPPSEVSIAMYRDAVGTLCAELKIPKIIVAGHSMGGLVALSVAATWPERVAGLVLIGSGAKLGVSDKGVHMIHDDFAAHQERILRVAWSPATPKEIVERWGGISFTAEQEITEADYRSIQRFDGNDLLSRIKTPTLVIGGADDLMTPPKLSHALGVIPGSVVKILPHAGHMMMLEQPEAFFAELDPFLAQIP
jgi:pimeloyl-ACP methyl ester carboxylesterase